MQRERFEQIAAKALEMVDLIEWCELAGVDELACRELLDEQLRDPRFRPGARICVRVLIQTIDQHQLWQSLPGVQEIELEAAGLVQSAAKAVLADLVPHPYLANSRLRTKFSNIAHPLEQAPMHMVVPSMADQKRGAKPWSPN